MGSNSPDLLTACNTATVGFCRSPVNDCEIKSYTSFLPEYLAASGRKLELDVWPYSGMYFVSAAF